MPIEAFQELDLLPTSEPKNSKRRWLTLAAFLAVAVLMYTSIMYKIINYGP